MLATAPAGKRRADKATRSGSAETLEFLGVLWALDQELRALSKRMQLRLGVTGPQRLALRIIGRSEPLRAGALASAMHLHPSTVTGVVMRLGRAGLVRRRRDPGDGRRVLLALTARGARIDRHHRGTVESAVSRMLHDLPPGQLAAAREVLERLRHSVARERASGASA